MTYKSNMTSDQAENLVDLKQVEASIEKKFSAIEDVVKRIEATAKESGSVSTELKSEIDKLAGEYNGLYDRIQAMEQKGMRLQEEAQGYDLGAEFVKSDAYQSIVKGNTSRARFEVKTAIINATGQNQPLVPADRSAGIISGPNRVLRVRDLMPSSPTTSNLIEFVKENVFTNNAGPQVGGSPEQYENVTKPESAITFTLSTAAVQTLAHFIPASRQVIEDSPSLQSFVNGRLTYGLKLKEETQLVSGTGSNGELNGIYTQGTAYTLQSPNLTNRLDIIRDMIKQAQVSEYMPDFILMNPVDWYNIDVMKINASDDRYVVGDPRMLSTPTLWGIPIVLSNSITANTTLVGNMALGCEIRDRQQAVVEMSLEDSTNFQKNMVTIRAEERIALVVYRTTAFIKAALPA